MEEHAKGVKSFWAKQPQPRMHYQRVTIASFIENVVKPLRGIDRLEWILWIILEDK